MAPAKTSLIALASLGESSEVVCYLKTSKQYLRFFILALGLTAPSVYTATSGTITLHTPAAPMTWQQYTDQTLQSYLLALR